MKIVHQFIVSLTAMLNCWINEYTLWCNIHNDLDDNSLPFDVINENVKNIMGSLLPEKVKEKKKERKKRKVIFFYMRLRFIQKNHLLCGQAIRKQVFKAKWCGYRTKKSKIITKYYYY